MIIEWKPAARAELRAIAREQALAILHALTRYAHTGEGDVTHLQAQHGEFRLRVGDYRVRFERISGGIRILHVRHRSQAYR